MTGLLQKHRISGIVDRQAVLSRRRNQKVRRILYTATFALAFLAKPNFQTPQLDVSHACARELNEQDFWQAIARISSRMELNDMLEELDERARHKKTAIERLEKLATTPDLMIREQTINFLRGKLNYAWMMRSHVERKCMDEFARILEKSLDRMASDEAKDTAREITGYYVRNQKWDKLKVLVVEHPNQQIRAEVRATIGYMAEIQSYRREMPETILHEIGIYRPDPR